MTSLRHRPLSGNLQAHWQYQVPGSVGKSQKLSLMSAQIMESPEEMSQRPFTHPVTPARVLPRNRSQLQQCTPTQSHAGDPASRIKGSGVLSVAQEASPEDHASTTMREVPEACTVKACQLLGP